MLFSFSVIIFPSLFNSISSSNKVSHDTFKALASNLIFSNLGSLLPFSQSDIDCLLTPKSLALFNSKPSSSCDKPLS